MAMGIPAHLSFDHFQGGHHIINNPTGPTGRKIIFEIIGIDGRLHHEVAQADPPDTVDVTKGIIPPSTEIVWR